MRLTITLDDDLYAMARAYGVANGLSISKAIAELLRQRVAPGGGLRGQKTADKKEWDEGTYFDPVLGVRVSRCERDLKESEIRAALDSDDDEVVEHFMESSLPRR